ncbi:MAG TPA: hypothetical protein VH475_00305 [Tepidisphaeraceae bacterium]
MTPEFDADSGRRRGVFQTVAELVESNELAGYELHELQALRKWFAEHLDAPDRFSRSQRSGASPKAICWFKSRATAHIGRMHAMCRILSEHGIRAEMIICARPGYVVFEDDHQVAAVPFAETTT